MFGLTGTPTTAGGRVKLLLHLLLPQARSDHAAYETIMEHRLPASEKRAEGPLS
jgi:hypothetical protein